MTKEELTTLIVNALKVEVLEAGRLEHESDFTAMIQTIITDLERLGDKFDGWLQDYLGSEQPSTEERYPMDPFEQLDLEEQIKPEHWKEVHTLAMPGLELTLLPSGNMTLKAPNVRMFFTREQVEAVTRFLQGRVKVEPLPDPDEALFDKRVDDQPPTE